MISHRGCGRLAVRLVCAVGASATLGITTAHAQSDIVDFNFTGHNNTNNPVPATFVATGINTPVLFDFTGPALALQSHANSYLGNNWPTYSTVQPNLNYFTFTMTPTAGNGIDLTGGRITLNINNGNQGPQDFVVRSSLDNFASDINPTPFTQQTGTAVLYTANFSPYLAAIGMTSPNGSPIEFRMYGYNAAATNKQLWLESTTAGTNAVVVTGSVVPVPEPALVLSAAAVVTGLSWSCRGVRRRCVA